MSRSPISVRSLPRLHRGVLRLPLGFLVILLCGAESPSLEGPPLENGLTLERQIQGGEAHVFPIELQAGEFLRVAVQEDGVNLAVRLFDPQGAEVTGADGAVAGHEKEDLSALAETSGTFRLEIKAASPPELRRYRLQVEGPREAGPSDRLRAEAVRATWAGFNRPVPKDEEGTRQQIASLERALSLWQQLREDRRSAEALLGLGRRRRFLADYARAAEDYQHSAALWASQPDREARIWQANCLNGAGLSLRKAARLAEARRLYEHALAVARALGDDAQQASSLSNLGILDSEEGELLRGMDRQREALELTRKAGDRDTEIKILNNLAHNYGKLSDHQQALTYYEASLALARERSDREGEATALNNLAGTYDSLGDWEKALDHYQRALELNRASGNRPLEARTLNNLGLVFRHLERFDEARDAFNQALALGSTVNDRLTQTFALSNQAFLSLRLQQPTRAIEFAEQALPLARGTPELEADVLHALGNAHRDLGDLPAARQELGKALDLARARGDYGGEAQTRLDLAHAERQSGDLTAALASVQEAIEIIESLRAKVVNQGLRASFLAAKQDYYELQIDTLMALREARKAESFAAEALQVSERARARSLLEILQEAGADIRQGASPDLIEREHRLREEVNARELHRLDLLDTEKLDEKKLAEAESKLKETLQEHQRVQDQLRESSPRYAALTQPRPLDVAEIQRQVLAGGGLLLEYALGAKRSFLWAVTPGSVGSFELPARDRIDTAARRYYELITARNDRHPGETVPVFKKRVKEADAEAGRAARELSLLILQPVEELLGDHPLLIVADGALQYIPFAALPLPSTGAPLASRHEVVNLPSASTLAVLRRELRGRQGAPRTLAIFADPVFQSGDKRLLQTLGKRGTKQLSQALSVPRIEGGTRATDIDLSALRRLPYSQTEADKIAALLPAGEVFKAIGFDASRATIASHGLENYRNVHFATHGVIDSRHPDLSGLVMSLYDERGERLNGVLRLNDIYNLRLAAELVVLSACRTALGKEIRGEGLIGLTRGFMYAGAARVLASLWSVEDQATAELMESFYRGMLRDGLTPAAALRKAQLEMAQKPNRKSPYFWAGFSLPGDWR